jgi:DnaJ-class molecular chaperone
VNNSNPTTPAVFLLAEWSVTTSAYAKYANKPYKDTPRSRWEASKAAAVKAAKPSCPCCGGYGTITHSEYNTIVLCPACKGTGKAARKAVA